MNTHETFGGKSYMERFLWEGRDDREALGWFVQIDTTRDKQHRPPKLACGHQMNQAIPMKIS